MRRNLLAVMAILAIFSVMACNKVNSMTPMSPNMTGSTATFGSEAAGNGFDELGYNRTARIFNGLADGVDGILDGKYYGSVSPYAFDKLKMKWNAEWDRGNAEGWSDPNGYEAHLDNQWNGKVSSEGSGEIWHYKIKWIGKCGTTGAATGDGGYCIWGQFEVLMSHGSVANEHFWDAHAIPTGYGSG